MFASVALTRFPVTGGVLSIFLQAARRNIAGPTFRKLKLRGGGYRAHEAGETLIGSAKRM